MSYRYGSSYWNACVSDRPSARAYWDDYTSCPYPSSRSYYEPYSYSSSEPTESSYSYDYWYRSRSTSRVRTQPAIRSKKDEKARGRAKADILFEDGLKAKERRARDKA